MEKYKKIIIGICIGGLLTAALYFAALFFIPECIDLNNFKEAISKDLEGKTGFKTEIEDISFEKKFSTNLNINLYHTVVLYPNDDIFIKLKNAKIQVKLLPLLIRKVEIKEAKLTRPVINITLYKDYTNSIDKYFKFSDEKSKPGFFNKFSVNTSCEQYKLKIYDETIQKQFYLEGEELNIKGFNLGDKINVILKGALYENKHKYLNYDLDITSFIPKEKQKLTFSPFKAIYESNIEGDISGKLNISKDKTANGNIKLNKISLNADGIILAGNSAILEFKDKLIDIDAVLHTSKTDEATLKGKYNFGSKKYIKLKTKANNINIANLHKLISRICQCLSIKNNYADLKITGTLNADFNLESDFNKLKSSGIAQIINADVKLPEIQYAINNINADINFDNNKIDIKKAQLNINSTPVKISGIINEDVSINLTAESSNLDIKNLISIFKIDSPLNISNGKISFLSDISGHINKEIKTKTNITVNNLLFSDKKYIGNSSIKELKVLLNADNNFYSGDFSADGLKIIADDQRITAEKLNFSFNSNQIDLPENKILILNSPFDIEGKITQYSKNPTADISFKGKINAENMGKYLNKYIKEPYKASGILKTAGKFAYKNEAAEIKAQINADEKNYISYAVIKELLNKPSVLNIEGTLKNEDFFIKDFSLYDGNIKPENKIISVLGNLQNIKNTELKNIKISIPKSISVSTNFLGGEDISLKADLNINGNIENPKINGTAKIHNLKVKKLLTLVKNADLNFSDNIIKLSAPDVQVNTSNFNISADILPDIKKKITVTNMQLNSYNLDVNSLFELLKNKENIISQIKTEIKKGSATINNFEILDLKATDISADFSFNNNTLKIKDINATAYNGNITGNIDYNLAENYLHLMLNGSGVDMKNSLYDLCKLEDNISGTVNFKSDLKLLTGEYTTVINSLSGDINFDSYNGKMGTLGKFEYYLYAQNIFYYGWLKANLNRIADTITKDNTAQYRKATGTLNFKDGFLNTNDLKTKGDNMSLFIKGRHNILSNQSNLEIFGRISDRISSKLGSFGEVSISDIFNNNSTNKKKISIVPNEIISNIPELYTDKGQTNTFKVNIYGDIKSVNSVDSFVWILSQNNEQNEQAEPLPDFSEIPNEEN